MVLMGSSRRLLGVLISARRKQAGGGLRSYSDPDGVPFSQHQGVLLPVNTDRKRVSQW